MVKLILFNIQKLKSISKSATFLNQINTINPDIIALTEYDITTESTTKEQILKMFENKNFRPVNTIEESRVQIFVNHTTYNQIIDTSIIQKSFQRPHNRYITDLKLTFDDTEIHICLAYAPASSHTSNFSNLTTITKEDFYYHFNTNIKSINLTNPIFLGDWNTPPNHTFNHTMGDLDCIDATSRTPTKYQYLPTNFSTGENRRLDRFYIHENLLHHHSIKYKLLQKQPYSTHLPIMLTIRPKSRRKKHSSNQHSPSFPTSLYSNRKSPFPHHLTKHPDLIKFIFQPTPIWEDNLILSMNHYIWCIQHRLSKVKRLSRLLPSEHQSTRENLYSNLKASHNSNPLCITYQQLNKRFKNFLNETTFSKLTMEKSHKLFDSLFNNNSITSLTDTEILFNSIFSNFIAPQLLDSEIQNLNAKFEETEIFNNLKALHQKGPSSPGPDGITYAAWFHSWEYSKLHIIQFINQIHFSTSQASQTVNSQSSIFNSIIKLIPKKILILKNPIPGTSGQSL